jgi:hypothetical protein
MACFFKDHEPRPPRRDRRQSFCANNRGEEPGRSTADDGEIKQG